jgi:arylsulfatase A-like enzyme
MQVYPYTIIGSHTYGTSHKTPYTHNTHVPLIWYQQGTIQKKQIHKKVLTVQIAPTLAHILGIPQPSAATSDILPGIL